MIKVALVRNLSSPDMIPPSIILMLSRSVGLVDFEPMVMIPSFGKVSRQRNATNELPTKEILMYCRLSTNALSIMISQNAVVPIPIVQAKFYNMMHHRILEVVLSMFIVYRRHCALLTKKYVGKTGCRRLTKHVLCMDYSPDSFLRTTISLLQRFEGLVDFEIILRVIVHCKER